MLRYLALTLLVGCSASAEGALFDAVPDAPAALAGSVAVAPEPATAGAPVGGSSAAVVETAGGRTPEPSAGAPSTPEPSAGAPTTAGAGGLGGAGGAAPTAGAPSAGAASVCPADFYCHELGPDAFAKCVVRPADPDPRFPTCEITRGACFYPPSAPESCIAAECWAMRRTCD